MPRFAAFHWRGYLAQRDLDSERTNHAIYRERHSRMRKQSAPIRAGHKRPRASRQVVWIGVAILALFATLWFPFDWLSTVWPAFGVPFRQVFHNAHDHFIGHTIFFFLVGLLVLALVPALRRKPQWYFPGLVLAALTQETIQAFFRGQAPSFTDFNAFKGDALGGVCAFGLWLLVGLMQRAAHRRISRLSPR